MRKDFNRKNSAFNRETKPKFRVFFIVVLLGVLSTIGFFIYQNKNKLVNSQEFVAYVAKFKNWALLRKDRLQQELQGNHPVAQNDNGNSPIHFEFYSTLPNMQIASSETSNKPALPQPITNHDQLEKEFAKDIKIQTSKKKMNSTKSASRTKHKNSEKKYDL